MRRQYEALTEAPRVEVHEFVHTTHAHNAALRAAWGRKRCEAPSVVCAGFAQHADREARPNMHHKFVVFGDLGGGKRGETFRPRAVWMGSFNFTDNSTRSLESAMYTQSGEAAGFFYEEWGTAMTLGEPLDWEYAHVAPMLTFGGA
jgi:hypothetical protein